MEQEGVEKMKRGESVGEVNEEKWVHDSSVDYKGRIPLRASTGVWKASLFIIAIEFSERLSYFGIAMNLITYLTKVLHQDLTMAAKNVNYWLGVTTMMPLIGGFLADSYFGRFRAVLISAFIYLLGLILLTMSEMIPSLKPCKMEKYCTKSTKIHEIIFFLSMYLISVGTGGHKPSLESFGGDQFDDDHSEERKKKMSYFNWWNFGLCCGLLLGVSVIVYVEDYVSWGAADFILSVVMAISIVIFYVGRPLYRFRVPEGSPLTPLLQVLVAAIIKRNLPNPSDSAQLYEVPKTQKTQGRLLCHTPKLKFFDKAAIIEDDEDINGNEKGSIEKHQSPWRLATVTKVEEMKLVLNMFPIWASSLIFGICIAQTATFFIKQSSTMNRRISHDFEIPPATIYALAAIGMTIAVVIYDKILEPVLRKVKGNERGIKILQRIGIGMVFSSVTMVVAALVERKRLNLVEREIIQGGLTIGGSVPMSVFWLIPQFLLIGIGDGFTLVGLQEYFYDQVPDSMRSLGIALYLSVIGLGSFLSSLLITIVDHVTHRSGKSWFGKDMNSSRVDNFYWLLAAMNAVNLCIYVFLARRYSYKNVQRRVAIADCYEKDGAEFMA
ncbi:protein NRT1/ PTR FAMILY 5.6-like [Macadamia integrifolia]|uniref:protein NRT1/ PTR FAMILY 5.6-like n=1 Tax=Macadamia integrifolia TaxID=60698 RepID=UPI001C4EA009|nr:protein NRT1/ PTR FAMILY 5.6-like [Macadamia integrifolia]